MSELSEELDQKYTELIKPSNLIGFFKTESEFIEWAQLGTTEDLVCAIAEFEKQELYEYCTILKQVHDSLINKQ